MNTTKTATVNRTPVVSVTAVPTVIDDLLTRVCSAVGDASPEIRTRFAGETAPKLRGRYLECAAEVRAAIEACLNLLLDRLADPTATAEEIAALAATCGELSLPHPAPGQPRLGIRLGRQGEPGTSEEVTVAHGGEPARALVAELDAAEATFAERLSVCLKRAGVSQSELAEKLGVRPSAVSMMLRRQSRPQPRTVARIAAALNVSPSDLWPTTHPSRPAPTDPVTAVPRLRASELARLPRAVWEPLLAAAAERAAEAYRTDPEFAGFDAFVFEAQYIDGEKVPVRASELLRWPARLREYYLAAAAGRAAEAYRTDPEYDGFEAHQYESQFLG